jgi:hypothetical protein
VSPPHTHIHTHVTVAPWSYRQHYAFFVSDFGLSKVYNPEAAGDGEMVGSPFYVRSHAAFVLCLVFSFRFRSSFF